MLITYKIFSSTESGSQNMTISSVIITLFIPYLLCLLFSTHPEKMVIQMKEASKNLPLNKQWGEELRGRVGRWQLPSSRVWRLLEWKRNGSGGLTAGVQTSVNGEATGRHVWPAAPWHRGYIGCSGVRLDLNPDPVLAVVGLVAQSHRPAAWGRVGIPS